MRKTILVGVLAAMMLFAFTACENSTPEVPIYGNATVVGASLASAPDYLDGDTLNPDEIKVNVLLNVGEPITYTGTEMGITAEELEAGANAAQATIPGTELKYDITVYAYKAEAYTVNLSTAPSTITAENYSTIQDSIQVSISYNNGSTMTRSFADVGFSWASSIGTYIDYKEGDTTVDVGAAFRKAAENDKTVTINGEWKPTISVAAAKTVKSISIKQDSKLEYFMVGDNKTLTEDNFKFTATFTYSDNTTDVFTSEELDGTTYDYEILNLATSGVTFSNDLKSFDLKIAIVDAEDELVGEIQTVTVKAVEDYPISFNVAQVKKTDAPTENAYEYWIGDDFAPQEFVFTVNEFASKNTSYTAEDKKIDSSNFKVVSPSKIKDGYTTEGNHSVTVTFEYIGSKKGAVAAEKPTCVVTLTPDAE